GANRRDVFLDHQFYGVRNRLQDAVGADAHRAEPRLCPRDHLALQQHHVGDCDERRVQHDEDLHDRDDEVVDHEGAWSEDSPWFLVLGPWSVPGPWSVLGPWCLVRRSVSGADPAPRTRDGLRTEEGPR